MIPCDWPVVWCCGETCTHYDSLSVEVAEAVMNMAIDRLRTWTNYGPCPREIRPCRSECIVVRFPSGRMGHSVCGCRSHPCSCSALSEIRLPGPVASITEITIDGAILEEHSYRVDNWKYLVRTDGGAWPRCQDMAADPTEPDTFVIDYMRGMPVPDGGKLALGTLVCQLSRAVCGDKCDLPMKASSVSRQGVSMTFDLQAGETGLFLIDDWVKTVNKGGARVLTPEKYYRQPREVTWQAA